MENTKEQEQAVQEVYNYAITLKKSGKTDAEIRLALTAKGLEDESAGIIINNLNQAVAQQPVKKEGSGFPSVLIYIFILIGINVLSAVFEWGFWIY